MAVSCVYIKFFNSQKSFSFLSSAPHLIKLKFLEIKNTVRVPSGIKLTKNPVLLHYFSKFLGILLFVLEYTYISLLLKMINGFSLPGKIMASPFKLWNLCIQSEESGCIPTPIWPSTPSYQTWYPVAEWGGGAFFTRKILLTHQENRGKEGKLWKGRWRKNGKFLLGKSIFHFRKKSGKVTLPPPKNINHTPLLVPPSHGLNDIVAGA